MNEIHGSWYDPSNPVVMMSGQLREDLFAQLLEWQAKAVFTCNKEYYENVLSGSGVGSWNITCGYERRSNGHVSRLTPGHDNFYSLSFLKFSIIRAEA